MKLKVYRKSEEAGPSAGLASVHKALRQIR
jgi:hypothetical protein